MEIVHVEAAQQWLPNRLSGDAGRPRVADDFEAIHARVEELRRERERAYLAVLPSCDTKRWVASRKAAVVIAVREGVISRGKGCDWYQLSSEELASWEVAFKGLAPPGFARGTVSQRYGVSPRQVGRWSPDACARDRLTRRNFQIDSANLRSRSAARPADSSLTRRYDHMAAEPVEASTNVVVPLRRATSAASTPSEVPPQ